MGYVLAFSYFACVFMTVPVITALIVATLRWSPLMLPYHIFRGKYELMEMEAEGSVPYWSIVLLDWTIFTGAMMGMLSLAAICGDAMIRIALICKALR